MEKTLITTSPCIRVCQLDETLVCMGCKRHLDDIRSWSSKTPEDKHAWWLANAPERVFTIPPSTPVKHHHD